MLRSSVVCRIKPFVHVMAPARTASEKGYRYRSSNINMHARIASIAFSQRTRREGKVALMLMVPDQVFASFALCGLLTVTIVLLSQQHPFSANHSRQQWLAGTMSEHEFFQRNDEMTDIIAMHADEARNTLEGIGMPEVFTAPSNYVSPSGKYAAEA